ncbi:hypothetical protein L486_03181 [Kwoniella mangroviensis CBS 10435]|uniref:Tubby C-terminal domain-containing protein n=1 Tax=Kwoniella mangroviensis CBS 10435 TaxID=1331196 RepID=A0A1B9IT29_9TREE|nr:hypothetical protein L486_03181 [Kwoniella mangroviensis CBS 10435]
MLKRLSYSLSGCDYDLYDQGGNILLRVRGSGLRPDYLNSYYDVENKEIFRVWTPPPLHYRAEAFRPHTTKDPIWNIENGRSRSRDKSKLYKNFLDVVSDQKKRLSMFRFGDEDEGGLEFVLDDGDDDDDDDDEMREVAVARMRFEIKGNKQKWRVDISSNFDYSLVIAMAVSLTTFGYAALIQVDP